MADWKITVDAGHLDLGSGICRDAADSARRAAEELAGAPIESGIFGDFTEAQQFRGKLDAAHQRHRDELHGHHVSLTDVSDKASAAAQAFTATDDSAASQINAVAEFE